MECTGLDAIRLLSGVFTKDQAVDRLALINLIVRGMVGEADPEFVKDTVLKSCNITLTDLVV